MTNVSAPDTGVDQQPAGGGPSPQPDSTDEIKAYIARLMATRPEPTLSQIQTVRDLLPPV